MYGLKGCRSHFGYRMLRFVSAKNIADMCVPMYKWARLSRFSLVRFSYTTVLPKIGSNVYDLSFKVCKSYRF